jgi:hypothetical protein
LELDPGAAEVVATEAAAFARAIPDPSARPRFEALSAAAASGQIPDEFVSTLETMLELLFTRGQPANRAVLQTVYGQTPRGKQQTSAAREVNQALKSLIGHQVADLRISALPGGHSLVIETDRVRLTLELDPAGARVASLEAG